MPPRRSSAASPANLNSPTGRVRSEYNQDTVSISDGSSSIKGIEGNPGEMKVISGLVGRIVNKLPCNSGIRLAVLEADNAVKASLQSLLELSRLRLPLVLQSLIGALDTLSKYTSSTALVDAPLDIIQSQIYVLHLICVCLSSHWAANVDITQLPPADVPRCFPDPPPLDDALVRYLLHVILIYARLVSADTGGLLNGTASPAPSRDGRTTISSGRSISQSATPQATVLQPGIEVFGSDFINGLCIPPRASKSNSPQGNDEEGLLSPDCSNTNAAIALMTRKIAQIVFCISSSNWSFVFTKIKARIVYLQTTIEDRPELVELRLLEWSNLNRIRLTQVIQEASTTFFHVKRPAQISLATAVRSAIWTWIDIHPQEYDSLIQTNSKLEGNQDALFDVLTGMADFSTSHAKRTTVFYPLMSMLLVLSPDVLKKLVMGDMGAKSSGLGKKASFTDSLRKGLMGNKGFEPCLNAYTDLIRAAMALSPRHEASGVRSLLPDIQNDVTNALFFSSHSSDLADTLTPAIGLISLYRANPSHVSSHVIPKIWSTSDLGKISVLRACKKLFEEGDRLPWYPRVATLRQSIATLLRTTIISTAQVISGDKTSAYRKPRASLEGSPTQQQLILDILYLYNLDPMLALSTSTGVLERGSTINSLLSAIAALLVGSCPEDLRLQAGKAIVVIIDHLTRSIASTPEVLTELSEVVPSIWQAVADASRQMLYAFHSGDGDDFNSACDIARSIIISISRSTQVWGKTLTSSPSAKIAVLPATVALITALAGPDVEQSSLAAPALHAHSLLIERVYDPPDIGQASTAPLSSASNEEVRAKAHLLEELSLLPPALGRQQHQRQIRRLLRSLAPPSTFMSAVWLGLHHRAKNLMSKMGRMNPEDSFVDLGSSRRALEGSGLGEDETKEWQNVNALAMAIANVCFDESPNAHTRLTDVVGAGILPRLYDEYEPRVVVETFIEESVGALVGSSLLIRESIKDALGSELPLSLCRLVVSAMLNVLLLSVGSAGINTSDSLTIFVENCILVLRLSVDRMQSGDPQLELGDLLQYLAQYLARLGKDDIALRMKMRFCQLMEVVLSKPDMVVLSNEANLRNTVLDLISEWSFDAQTQRKDFESYQSHPGPETKGKAQRDLDTACLKALVALTDGLTLKSVAEDMEDTQAVVKSRMFYRYYSHLVKILERPTIPDDVSYYRQTLTTGPGKTASTHEDSMNHAILALSNLLSANIDVGLKHCLALGYHEDPNLRVAFMQLMSNVLQLGGRFSGLGAKRISSKPRPYLDLLTSSNLALAVAVCEVCPGSEMDDILGIIFRSFEAKGNLLGLIKVLIEKEVAQTNHESELFRANTVTTRMLTLFGRTYGYDYVRTTLSPLIQSLAEKPAACSFELDPSKAGPNENIEQNADHVRLMCQALLDVICSTALRVPVMFSALCHQIWEIVEDRFPDSRHSAVGSFIFLRIFCPSIVAPDALDLDIPVENRDIRRALLLITKVIQNLANNVVFKEPHMKILNSFLTENIRQVTKFLSDIAVRPRSWEVNQAVKDFQEEADALRDPEADEGLLHRHTTKHSAKISAVLGSMPPSYRRSNTVRAVRADIDGQAALAMLRATMDQTARPHETSLLSASTRTQLYDEFMRHHAGRSVESVSDVFYEGPASQNGRRIFYFIVSRAAMVDYDLLSYLIYTLLAKVADFFDLVVDLTDFSPSCELPSTWMNRTLQLLPPGVLACVNTLALYNPNTYTRRRIKRVGTELASLMGKTIVAVSSPAELAEYIPFTSLALPEFTMALAYEADQIFTNLTSLSDHGTHVPVVLKLGPDALQVASWRKQDFASGMKAYCIDVVRLVDVDDIVTGHGDAEDQIIIKYSKTESITLTTKRRNDVAQTIRAARGRLHVAPSEERALRPNDVPGTLLNIALLNLSSSDEILRSGAFNLYLELGQFFKFSTQLLPMKVTAGLRIPHSSVGFILELSKGLALSAPHLTLEFLKEWTIGFMKGDPSQKIACLQYVGPWIENLDTFPRAHRENGLENAKEVSEIIRSVISVTITERKRLHLAIHENIWLPLRDAHESLTDIIVSELLHIALDSGIGSEKTDCAGDILYSICTIAVRGRLIAFLRKTIAQTYLRPSDTLAKNRSWSEICVFARLNLIVAFSPVSALSTQLFLPELCHILTLLVDSGPLLMRQTIYGLLMSITQSLAASPISGDMDSTSLQELFKRAQAPNMLATFGLTSVNGSLELLSGSKEEQDIALLDGVESLAVFLGELIVSAASSIDTANAWRARWMGLVAGTCFQHNPATQPQAFTVLGYLTADEVDDDMVYQVLVAMSTTLSHFSQTDNILITSMIRCLSRIMTGLGPESNYASNLFWLAVGIMEMGYIPLFHAALELMSAAMAAVVKTARDKEIDTLSGLLKVRAAMGEPGIRIDQIAGVSFDQDPSFCLVAIIFKGMRHPSTRAAATKVLFELLKWSVLASGSHTHGPEEDSPLIGEDSVAYFVALLPNVASNREELRLLFATAGLDVGDESLSDLSSLSVFDLLSVPANSSAILLVTLVVTILNSAPSDTERLILYRLLADASLEMPEVLSMAYDTLLPRLTATLQTSSHPALIASASTILSRAMADSGYSFPSNAAAVANESQASLNHNYSASISSIPGSGVGMGAVLDDLGMRGLGEGGFAPVKVERLAMTAKWVAALIESFTL